MSRHAEEESLLTRALDECERDFGPNHPRMAPILMKLAGHYEAMGRYADALPLRKRLLGISDKEVGPSHAETAKSLNNLASVYQAMGIAEALRDIARALEIGRAHV